MKNLIACFAGKKFAFACVLLFILISNTSSLAQTCGTCPPVQTCSECVGGLTQIVLQYNGPFGLTLSIDDDGGNLYSGILIASGTIITLNSSDGAGQLFNGGQIHLTGTLLLENTTVDTSCETPIFQGSTIENLVVISATLQNGKALCCVESTLENVPPVINNCPTNQTRTLPNNACSMAVTWTAPTATDNCTLASLVSVPANGSTFNPGVTPVIYTATDIYGNTSTCTFNVTVNDPTVPSYTNVPSNTTVNVTSSTCTVNVSWPEPTLNDNCPAQVNVVRSHTSGQAFAPGTYTVTYTATDPSGNVGSCSFTVTVNDPFLPTVTCSHPAIHANADADCKATATWTPPVFADNCSVIVTSTHDPGDEFELGSTQVTYTGTDPSGNARTCSFMVIVHDVTDPVLAGCPTGTLYGSATTSCGAQVTWTEPTATDNCDDTPGYVDVFSNYEPNHFFPVGTTTVTYTAMDDNGNYSECSFDVTVTDDAAPVIANCPSDITVFADGDCLVPVPWTEPTATDNCSTLPFTKSHLPGSSFGLGTTTVTYSVKDPSDNTSTCTFTVTVVDNTPPVLTNCPTDMIVSAGANCEAVVVFPDPTVNDNCGATLSVSPQASGTSFALGETTVTFTATDAAGNASSCSFKVTVVDNTPPVFTNCPTDITVNVASGCEKVVSWTEPDLDDNCSATVDISHASGSALPLGETIVTYEARDGAGNTALCTFTVTVVDNVAPVITNCPADIVETITTGCDKAVTWTPPTIGDDCDVDLLISHDPGDVFPVGTTTVTYQATDQSGNQSTCSFTVTVQDIAAPVISNCPSDITLSADGDCLTPVSWTEPTATDNCSALPFTKSHLPGSLFALGTTTVTYTVKDPSNNTSTCTFTVTIVDNTPPVLSNCPTDMIVSAGSNCQAIVNFPNPTFDDNCSVTLSVSPQASGTSFSLGETNVTFTATDGAGNASTCSFKVTVVDTTPPVFTNCPTNITVNVADDCEKVVTWTEPDLDDNCSATVDISHPSGSAFPLGETIVTYEAKDGANNTAVCTFTVTVVDNVAPVFTNCPADMNLSATTSCGAIATWPALTFDEDCSVTITSSHNSGDTFPIGTTTVEIEAEDGSGNVSTCSFTITVEDDAAPVISCIADITVSANASCEAVVTWSDPSATDNCSAIVSSDIVSGSTFELGSTPVEFTATDPSGNTSTCTINVIVIDDTDPVITGCPANITVNADGSCAANVNWTEPLATDNCTVVMNSTHVPGASFAPGVTTVTYTAEDGAGNITTCSFDVNVVDVTSPVISGCPSDITVAMQSNCETNVVWTAPNASDNCSVTLTSSHDSGDVFSAGTTTVIYEATDPSGNVTTCSFDVTVVDSDAPVISSCPSDIELQAGADCKAIATWTAPTATDACTLTLTSTHTSGVEFGTGTTTVTYTATDSYGNTSACSFNVVVRDAIAPVLSNCPENITLNGDGNCQAAATWAAPSVQDDCAFTLTSTHASGSSFPVGITTVTYTAQDASGNSAVCSFTVTVTDVLAPVITGCPSTVRVSAGTDCRAAVTWTPPQAADCSAMSITDSHSPGEMFPLGTTIVTYSVTDQNGLSSSCSFEVVVEDTTGPVFSNCPQDITIEAGESCDAVVSWTAPGANDNCSTASMTQTHHPGQTFPMGTTQVQYTATDAAGNVSTCEFSIHVVNGFLPVISGCPEDLNLKADESGQVIAEWIEPTAEVKCADVSMESNHSSGSNFSIGTTAVVYTATSGSGKTSTCSFNVVVAYEELSFDVNQLLTPDGDGINDQWTIANLEKFKDNKVVIVDRWGSVVYQASGYNNENVVWKGTGQNGVAAPTGTYYYTISVRFLSEVREKKGFIELIR